MVGAVREPPDEKDVNMNSHKKINKMLSAYVLGELSAELNQQVRSHLAGCQTCTNDVKRLEGVLSCAENVRSRSIDDNAVEAAKAKLLTAVSNEKTTTAGDKLSPALVWRTIMKSSITKFAAAAVIIVIIGVLAYNHMESVDIASVAWATVVDNVQAAKCISYTYIIEDSNRNAEHTTRVMYMPPDCVREEKQFEGGKSKISIRRANKILSLYPETQTATMQEYRNTDTNSSESPVRVRHLWQNFKRDYERAKFVGTEKLDGNQTDIFAVESSNGMFKSKFWVNKQTSLPIYAEIAYSFTETDPFHRKSVRYIFTEFAWNNLDESLFSMQVPTGYKVKNYSIDIPVPSEKALVDALGACAELTDGNFPAQFEEKPMAKFWRGVMIATDNAAHDTKVAIYEKFLKVNAGLKFLKTLQQENRDWHYCGDGVKLGDEESPICWWKTDSGLYRVVYGNLSVADCNSDPNDL
jgi:hypothetical protein